MGKQIGNIGEKEADRERKKKKVSKRERMRDK